MASSDNKAPFAPEPHSPVEKIPLAKRAIASLAGQLLSKLDMQHTVSWQRGYAEGYNQGEVSGSSTGHAEGYKSGHTAGHIKGDGEGFVRGKDVGYKEGHAAGVKDGMTVLEIRDHRVRGRAAPGIDSYLFDRWILGVAPALVDRFRADVTRILPEYKQPTPDQWKMILSETPSTYVIAGAGSGKSTTLVLRILFLHLYLGYELDAMTVVTFTNMSRQDFIRKLQEVFRLWDITVNKKAARALVSTFHSKILSFVRCLPEMDRVAAFEFYKGEAPGAEYDAESDDSVDSEANESMFDTRLHPAQLDLLNACYRDLYATNESFRGLIQILYTNAQSLKTIDATSEAVQKSTAIIKKLSKQDKIYADAVEAAWRLNGKWPMTGIDPARGTIKVLGQDFQIHGRIASLGVAVVLGARVHPGDGYIRPGADYELYKELISKQRLLQAYCTEKIVWLEDPAATASFLQWLAGKASVAPGFDYQIEGEISPKLLVEAFTSAAGFIENLGLDVPHTISMMQFVKGNIDRVFFEALGLFWPAFEESLMAHRPRIMTFNRMFALFGETSPVNLRTVPHATLRSMSHLMIDEFQDISPQIVSWVRATLREVRRRGEDLYLDRDARHSSLLCVGDDWQSIYGWRGSAPKYFIEFEDEFKASKTTRVMLSENFRSHQYVIDAAEHIVRDAPGIEGKKAVSAGKARENPVPVKVMKRDDEALAALALEHYDSGETVMVLYRKGADRDELLNSSLNVLYRQDRKLPKDKRRLQLLTYHKSKGLEADAVLLVGDCVYIKSSPYKNQTYLSAGLGNPRDASPYDTSQKHELLRLAYVAITRAARHCYWFIDPPQGDAASKPKASDHIPKSEPFFIDARGR